MKTVSSPGSKSSAPPVAASPDREEFFQRCYFSLLGSACSQFEVYDEHGGRRELFKHSSKLGEEAIDEAEEDARIQVLVDRCYAFALAATERYFEGLESREFNSEV